MDQFIMIILVFFCIYIGYLTARDLLGEVKKGNRFIYVVLMFWICSEICIILFNIIHNFVEYF